MANYSLIINSKFRPFEFEEMLKPVMIAEQAHREVEDAYTDLITKTNIWDKLTNAATDKKTHSLYSAYSKALEQEADRLAKQGLSPSSRQSLLNMRSRYAQDIVPIENAYKRKQAQIEEQRKAGNSMIYDYDASTISLDRFLENPALSYRSINRGDLYTRAVNDFSQYAKALQDYGNGKRLDKFTKTFIQQYGITQDDARNFIEAVRSGNINTANPTLRAVYDALYNSTGVGSWDNPQAQNIVSNTILEGVGAAIGKTAISPYEDKAAAMAQQLANSKELARYQSELQTPPPSKRPLLIPRPLRSQKELEQRAALAVTYKKYFTQTPDGKWVLNKQGQDEYNNTRTIRGGYGMAHHMKSSFRLWMESLGSSEFQLDGAVSYKTNGARDAAYRDIIPVPARGRWGKWQNETLGKLFSDAYNQSEVYDTYHSTEYVRQIPESYGKEVRRQVISEPEVLQQADFNGKNGWNKTSIEKSALEGFVPSRINYSRYGTTITWVNDNGESIRTMAPRAINERVTDGVQTAMYNASVYQQVVDRGFLPQTDTNGHIKVKDGAVQFTSTALTADQKKQYYNEWNNSMDEMSTVGAMYVAPSNTPNTEYPSYDFSR